MLSHTHFTVIGPLLTYLESILENSGNHLSFLFLKVSILELSVEPPSFFFNLQGFHVFELRKRSPIIHGPYCSNWQAFLGPTLQNSEGAKNSGGKKAGLLPATGKHRLLSGAENAQEKSDKTLVILWLHPNNHMTGNPLTLSLVHGAPLIDDPPPLDDCQVPDIDPVMDVERPRKTREIHRNKMANSSGSLHPADSADKQMLLISLAVRK